ncbi:EF-P lysine aminoacylase EpmA [Thiomicrorhabdus sp.]|uniref:EF-P lysine aminoacylase EpmA n=1 Tax=Thiomicrorhabdus sp. TaxID=2039724 RepID=UPI0029C6A28B|nr:EF-P lysine aminoacylase EpmA [Thiomicrorhabdus sp.]
MSRVRNNPHDRRSQLQKRSQLLQSLRAFFYERDLIEVETPMLSAGATPDLHLGSLHSYVQIPGVKEARKMYWHTSPEYPMKRLLCEGSGDIFYLGKVFRDGDLSPRHQVEFTMLEWYRTDFTLQQLINEVCELVNRILPRPRTVQQLSYRQAFADLAGIGNIFEADAQICQRCLKEHGVPEVVGVDADDKPLWEQLILTEVIEPKLGQGVISVLYDFPARDAALARLNPRDDTLAERFEVFVDAMELANGYRELTDGRLYRERFEDQLRLRADCALPMVPLDEQLLQTLNAHPLPDCSGVALGVDRLFMLQQEFERIEQGLAFGLLDA